MASTPVDLRHLKARAGGVVVSYYSRRHYRLVSPPPDAPGAAAERIRYRAAAEQALAEMRRRFPVLTTENFAEADRFRETRTQELLREEPAP